MPAPGRGQAAAGLLLGLGLGLSQPAPCRAQQPTVSPAVSHLLGQDSVVALWLFAQPGYPLDDLAAAVTAAGGHLRRRSEWLHAISADLDRRAFEQLRSNPGLAHIQPVARFRGPGLPPPQEPLLVPRAPRLTAEDSLYGPSAMPFRRLHLFPLIQRGLDGTGVRIAILDTGFETSLPAFARTKVVAQRDFVFNDDVVRNQPGDAPQASRHGTATWSLLAAQVPGSLIGVAPAAEYLLAKTEDVRSETRVEEDNYVAALEWAASLGARVVSSSLGYLTFDGGFAYRFDQLNGDIAVTTVAADLAAQRGIAVVTAVGNGGPAPRSLVTPADGDSVIAVGAEDSTGILAGFSSRGPTADGRVKPDVVAPGVAVWVLDTQASSGFSRLNGTSFATPLIAGAAALLSQLHPQLTGVELRDALRRAGTDALRPDNNRGWGLPDVLAAATFPYGIVLASPRDTLLESVTPTFAWSSPGVPAFAQPVQYRVTLTRADTTVPVVLLDTTLTTGTAVTLSRPQRPGRRLAFLIRALAADSAALAFAPEQPYRVPRWASLLTLDDPAGVTIRQARPRFAWSAPAVTSPPGPFRFDVEIFRTDNGEVVAGATNLDSTAFTPPADLELNTPHRWRVIAHLAGDTAVTESRGAFLVTDESVPPLTVLFQNFPNPFPNPSLGLAATCFWFDLAHGGRVRLEILDLRGHVVRRLVPNAAFSDPLPAGRYGRPGGAAGGRCDANLEWDGRSDDGRPVPPGVYVAKLVTPDGTFFKRAVFLGAR